MNSWSGVLGSGQVRDCFRATTGPKDLAVSGTRMQALFSQVQQPMHRCIFRADGCSYASPCAKHSLANAECTAASLSHDQAKDFCTGLLSQVARPQLSSAGLHLPSDKVVQGDNDTT